MNRCLPVVGLAVAAMLLLAACETQSPWQKQGVALAPDPAELLECRRVGQKESLRAYAKELAFPFHSPPFFGYMAQPNRELWERQVEIARSLAASVALTDCMRGKGYERALKDQPLPVASSIALSRTGQYSLPWPSSTARSITSRATSEPSAGTPFSSAISMA